jgi:uncharacterized protein (DUF2147 family)
MYRAPIAPVLIVSLLSVIAFLPGVARAEHGADAVVGLWQTEPDDGDFARVRISRQDDGTYAGKIVWLNEPNFPASEGPEWEGKPKVDRLNPDPALRDRPIIGLEIVRGFRYDGDDVWVDGKIYDPKKGKTYSCKMTLREDGSLFVRGFIGFSFIGRTTVWERVESAE